MKDWGFISLGPDDSIHKAIEIIDAANTKFAIVSDPKSRLLGTVTDGDVRRGILRGSDMKDPVKTIMRPNPVTVNKSEDRESILKLMKQKKIHQIPVLDDEGHIVRVEFMDHLLQSTAKDNAVVLMAGGMGKRLMPLTKDTPKPLLKVGNKPILQTILENLLDQGFNKFYMSVNYMDDQIRDFFGDGSRWKTKIEYLREDAKLGTAGSLRLLPEGLTEPIIVMNGDLLTKVNFSQLLDFHMEQGAAATMCVREYDFQVPYGVVAMEDQKIVGIDEKPVHSFFVNAGIYVLEPSVLDSIPAKGVYDMPQLFDELLLNKEEAAAFPIREYWLDIGHLDDFERAKGEFSEVFKA